MGATEIVVASAAAGAVAEACETAATDDVGTGVAMRVTLWYELPLGSMLYSARLQLPSVRAQAAKETSLVKEAESFFMGKQK